MSRKRKIEETKQEPIEQDEQDEQMEPEEGIIHRCDLCGARFIKGCGLASHMRTHCITGKACPSCQLVCKTRLDLNRHMRYTHGSQHPSGTLPPMGENTVEPAPAPVPPKKEIKKEDELPLPVPQKSQKAAPTVAGSSTQPSTSSAIPQVEEKMLVPPVVATEKKLPYTCPICQYRFETKMRAAYHFQSHRKKKWVYPKTARADYRKLGREKRIGFNIGSKLVEKWRMNCEYRPISVRRTQLWHFMEENFGCPLDKTFKTDQDNTRVQRVLRSQPGTSSAPAVKKPPPPPAVQKPKLPKTSSAPKMKKLLMKGKTCFGQMLCLGSQKFYLCRGCPYVTWNQSSLWRHTRHHIHRSKNAFTCSACTYSSIHLHNIQHHVKAHKRTIDVKHDYADWLRYEREINCPDFSGALGDEVDTITVPTKKRKVLPASKEVISPRRTRSKGAPLNTVPSTPKAAPPKVEVFPSPPDLVHKDQYVTDSKTSVTERPTRAALTRPPVLQPMKATTATPILARPVRATSSTARAPESTVKVTRASARISQNTSQTPGASVCSNKTAEMGIRTGPPPSKMARTTQLSPSIPVIPVKAEGVRWPSLISKLSSSVDEPDHSPITMKEFASSQKNVEPTKAATKISAKLPTGKPVSVASTSTAPTKIAVKNVEVAHPFQTTSSTKATPMAPKTAMPNSTVSNKGKAVALNSVTVQASPAVVAPVTAASTTSVKTVTTGAVKVTPKTSGTAETKPTTSGTVKTTPAVVKSNGAALATSGVVKVIPALSETGKPSPTTTVTSKTQAKSAPTTTAAAKVSSTQPGSAQALPRVPGAVKTASATPDTVKAAATTSTTGKAVPSTPSSVKVAPMTPAIAKATLTAPGAVKATSAATSATKTAPVVQAKKYVIKGQSTASSATPTSTAKAVTSSAPPVKPITPISKVAIAPATVPTNSVATSSSITSVTPKLMTTPVPSTAEYKKPSMPPKPVPTSAAVTSKQVPKPVPVIRSSGVAPAAIAPPKVSTTIAKPTSSGLSTQGVNLVPVTPKPVVAVQPKPVTVAAPKMTTPTVVVPNTANQAASNANSQVSSTSASSDSSESSTEVVPAAKPRYRLMVQYNAIPTEPPKLFKVLITSPEKDPPPKKETRSAAEKSELFAKKPAYGVNQTAKTTQAARVVSSSSLQLAGSIDQPLDKVYANMAARVQSSKQKIDLTEFKAPGQATKLNSSNDKPTSSASAAKSTPPVRKSARTIAMAEKIKEEERRKEEIIRQQEENERYNREFDLAYKQRRIQQLKEEARRAKAFPPKPLTPYDIAEAERAAEQEKKKQERKAAASRVLAEYAAEQKARKEKHEREWREKHGSIPPPELKCNITAMELHHRIVAAKFGLTIPEVDEPETPPPQPVLQTGTGKKSKVQHFVPEVPRQQRLHPLIHKYDPLFESDFENLVKQYKENEALTRANAEPGQEGVPLHKLVMKYAKQREYIKTETEVERTGQCADCPFHDRKNLDRLRLHRDKHFLNGPHKCPECNYSNFDGNNVRRHMFVDHYLHDVKAVEGISSTESEEDEPMPPPQQKKKTKRRRRANW